MHNPWEEIDLKVYENHMSLQSVHQLQALNELMKGQLHTYDVNTAMNLMGLPSGPLREPLCDMNDDTLEILKKALKDSNLI